MMTTTHSKRVVVTGLGTITSIGRSVSDFKAALFDGKCGIGPVSLFDTTAFPCQLAAQIRNGNLNERFHPTEIRRVSRADLLGLIAAQEAMTNSGLNLDTMNRNRIGVVLGGGAGGMSSWEKFRRASWSAKEKPRPSLLLPTAQSSLTDLVANRYRLSGYRATISTACSSGATSIGYSFDLIRSGVQDVLVAGGSEALSELTFAGFNSLRLVDPEYCRPFDKNRKGLSLGEGAAILILEHYSHAKQRGATIYGEVLGYAVNSDAYHMTSPDPEGLGMSRVMAMAIKRARIDVEQVNYVNAHGTGTRKNDLLETKAIKRVFGDKIAKNLAISSTKSMIGHCLGAVGAIEAVATVLSLQEQKAPPTIHLQDPDPECNLDYIPNQSKPIAIENALCNSFAFGGNNTSLIFCKAHT